MQVTVEDRDAARKEATDRTWPEIVELGLIAAERLKKEQEDQKKQA